MSEAYTDEAKMVKVKEHPIIFSTDMVQAILEGRKTQTRRVIKPQPEYKERNPNLHISTGWCWNHGSTTLNGWKDKNEFAHELTQFCPYGQVGDRLWVKESFLDYPIKGCLYKADYATEVIQLADDAFCCPQWKPSIFMPRWASRITLEITGVRVERLQEITEEDCIKEGCTLIVGVTTGGNMGLASPRYAFMKLWDSINAKRGYGWDTNCWVWVISFRRLTDEPHKD